MLPHLLLHIDVELADTLQGQLLLLYQDPDRFTHELLCDLQNVSWHSGRQEDNLKPVGKKKKKKKRRAFN